MLNPSKAFSSFSVNDIQKAGNFMARRWRLKFRAVRRARWLCRWPVA
jgi:hypothetical protein